MMIRYYSFLLILPWLLLGCGGGKNDNSNNNELENFVVSTEQQNNVQYTPLEDEYCPTPDLYLAFYNYLECSGLEDDQERAACNVRLRQDTTCGPQPEPLYVLNDKPYYGMKIISNEVCGAVGTEFTINVIGEFFANNDIRGAEEDITAYSGFEFLEGGDVAATTSVTDEGLQIVFAETGFINIRMSLPYAVSKYTDDVRKTIFIGSIEENNRPIVVRQKYEDGCGIGLYLNNFCNVARTGTFLSFITYEDPDNVWPIEGVHINSDCTFSEFYENSLDRPDFHNMPLIELAN